jgi:glycosyltransferase involved in cell wall biosynthesis
LVDENEVENLVVRKFDQSNNPTIAVVIPMFNGANHIGRAIGSVYGQTLLPNEIIVIDDGSTDGGSSLVEKFFPQVRVLSQSNLGVSHARNSGVELSKTDWIAFLDSDDFWLPHHLETAVDVINKFPASSFISTGIQKWDISTPLQLTRKIPEVGQVDYFRVQLREPLVVSSSSALVKKSIFQIVGGFKSQKIHEDTDMWERLALNCVFSRTTAITAVYVDRPDSASNKYRSSLRAHSHDHRMHLYQSKNTGADTYDDQSISFQRYKNRLQWTNVKTLLLHNDRVQAKKLASTATGSMRIRERICLVFVTICPKTILRILTAIQKMIKSSSS